MTSRTHIPLFGGDPVGKRRCWKLITGTPHTGPPRALGRGAGRPAQLPPAGVEARLRLSLQKPSVIRPAGPVRWMPTPAPGLLWHCSDPAVGTVACVWRCLYRGLLEGAAMFHPSVLPRAWRTECSTHAYSPTVFG